MQQIFEVGVHFFSLLCGDAPAPPAPTPPPAAPRSRRRPRTARQTRRCRTPASKVFAWCGAGRGAFGLVSAYDYNSIGVRCRKAACQAGATPLNRHNSMTPTLIMKAKCRIACSYPRSDGCASRLSRFSPRLWSGSGQRSSQGVLGSDRYARLR